MSKPISDAQAFELHVTCGRTFERELEYLRAQNPEIGKDGCGRDVALSVAYRCTECTCWFHRHCALEHFAKHRAERLAKIEAHMENIRRLLSET